MDKTERFDVLEQVLTGMEDRRREVAELLALRHSKSKIATIVAKKFNVTRATIYKDIKYVVNFWREESKLFSIDEHLHMAINVREAWIEKALRQKNIKLAWEIQKDFDGMLGLYNQQKEPEYKIIIHKMAEVGCDADNPVSDEDLKKYMDSVEDEKAVGETEA